MGYHHCHIPDLETLMKQYDALGLERFVARYTKYESLIGDSEGIRYIEHMCKILNEINSK
jgi:hypothetical protein